MESASVRTRGQTPACARMRCGVARIVDGLDDGLDGLDDGFPDHLIMITALLSSYIS